MSNSEDGFSIFPVADMTVGPIPTHGVVAIRLDFLTNPLQPDSEANPGRHYALTPVQARFLAQKILEALRVLETAGPPKATGPLN